MHFNHAAILFTVLFFGLYLYIFADEPSTSHLSPAMRLTDGLLCCCVCAGISSVVTGAVYTAVNYFL